MHCVNTAYFPWNIGFTFVKMAFKLSFGSLTEHVENSEKELFASFNYKYFIICKVIRVKYAYNHIQVRPAYNK